jgi:hypothetical protein
MGMAGILDKGGSGTIKLLALADMKANRFFQLQDCICIWDEGGCRLMSEDWKKWTDEIDGLPRQPAKLSRYPVSNRICHLPDC